MTIHINGDIREVPNGLTLAGLVEWLKLPADRVAIEHNLTVVSRSRWHETPLQPDDRVEMVQLVGGGTSNRTAGG